MNRAASLSLLCLAACATADDANDGVAQIAASTTTAFQDGVAPSASYAGTRDTMLEEDHPSTSHGGDKALSASGDTPSDSDEDDVVVLRWDLAGAIPSTAIVRGATIVVNVSDKADQTYALYEVLRDWDEATATWKRASTALAWDSSGADGAGDRGTATLGSVRASSTGSYRIALTAAGIAAVQRWVADPTTNHGVMIASSSNDNRLELRSREDSKAKRPRLEIAWDAGGTSTSTSYRETCDGSAVVALDATHFLDFSDEDQVARIYTRGASAAPVQQRALASALGMTSDDEADLEDAARVGDRVYLIASHGRNKDGELALTRHRFAAIDVTGTAPSAQLAVAGWTDRLLDELLDARRWLHPDAGVLAALASATQLSRDTVADLAPEVHGLNIEGLAAYPSAAYPERLLIGLRNPASAGRALLITLLNPAQLIAGAPAQFGEVIALELGGLGVRSLTWSEAHQAMLIIAGPIGDGGPVQLFRWTGDVATSPVRVQDLVDSRGGAAEAVVAYPGSQDLQIVFDDGGASVGGSECKKLATSAQAFDDLTIHLP